MKLRLALLLSLAALATPALAQQQQMGDPAFRPVLDDPAYTSEGPLIQLDAAHGSAQTIDGRYAGFAALARADGYRVRAGEQPLDVPDALDDVDVLVIANAVAPADGSREDAFTGSEIAVLDAWIRSGGSLLLAVDHAPYGSANATLGQALGVKMGQGYAYRIEAGEADSLLTFSTADGTLGDHPILQGRSEDEAVSRVLSFTGQSLSGPPGSTILLALRPDDREAVDARTLRQITDRITADPSAEAAVLGELSRPALPAQGLALAHGQGRVVVLGEAGMLTAQIIRSTTDTGYEDFQFGLQTAGHDDQRFALNILHWLSRLEGLR